MMANDINVEFGDGKKLTANIGGFKINTDQPANEGGEASAPTPQELFMASLANCAAHYARDFCESRSISMDGMSLRVEYKMDYDGKLIRKFMYQLTLPEGFPEKYKAALLRAVDLCTIKKQLLTPPAFQLELV